MNKSQERWALALGGALLLFLAGYFALTKAINHYLNDGALAHRLGRKTAVILKADAGYRPLFWRGLTVRSEGLLARGKPPQSLTEMRVKNLRAACSLQDLWRRKFVVRRLRAERLEAAFGAAAAGELTLVLPAPPELQPQIDEPAPLKLEIRETIVDQMNIFWGAEPEMAGALREVLAKFYPNGSALDGVGTGGTVQQNGWPKLRIVRIETHYAKPKLEIRSARFAIGKNEDTSAIGEFDLGAARRMRLEVQTKSAPVEPFLHGFWRGKIEGKIDGDSRIEKEFTPGAKATAAGEVKFSDAEVHDVATLDRIAALTRRREFAHLKLSDLRGRYAFSGARLEVKDFVMEAKKLIRVEGHFVIEGKEIEGTFQVGATADVLDAIPGAREKVFTEARDGYFWTSMKLSGPLKHPREDLKQRLVAAAEEHFAKGLLAPIFKPGQTLLDLLKALYE